MIKKAVYLFPNNFFEDPTRFDYSEQIIKVTEYSKFVVDNESADINEGFHVPLAHIVLFLKGDLTFDDYYASLYLCYKAAKEESNIVTVNYKLFSKEIGISKSLIKKSYNRLSERFGDILDKIPSKDVDIYIINGLDTENVELVNNFFQNENKTVIQNKQ